MHDVSPFFAQVHKRARELGGYDNAHLHLDRAGTLDATLQMLYGGVSERGSHISLAEKHALIPRIHASPCYEAASLEARADFYLRRMIEKGTTRAATLVDTTADTVGLRALDVFLALRRLYAGQLDLDVGAYSPLGFRDDEPARWEIFTAAAERATFLGLLPERDDRRLYPAHIGFRESCRRGIDLAAALGKELHIHCDQMNHPDEAGAETVLAVLEESAPQPASERPRIWLVHVISPSAYPEARFRRLVDRMVAQGVGVICCPSAAISMRQHRTTPTPTHNSIARVLEMIAAGVHVRLGSDNICDITSPAGTPDLLHELFVLCNAVRYYDPELLAKLGAGRAADEADRDRVQAHLEADWRAIGGMRSAA